MTTSRVLSEQRLKLLKELERRQNLPINKYTPDSTPDRNQLSFHQSPARYRLGFGGNRAGKSVMTSYEVAAWARGEHRFQDIPPGPKEIYVVSAEYRTIYHGIYRHLRPDGTGKAMRFLDQAWIKQQAARVPGATVPLPSYIQVYCTHNVDGTPVHPQQETRPFSTIWFISGDGGEQARKKLQAAAVDLIVIDEEIEYSLYDELRMRILDSDGRIAISATLVRSEDWLLNLEDKAEEGDPTVALVRLNSESSPHLSEAAKRDIYAGLTPEERAVRVEGKSRRQFGLVYPDFGLNHIFDKTELFPKGFPSDWPIIVGSDPGFRVHAALWAVLDVSSCTAYFYRELYEREAMLEEVCRAMAESEGYELVPANNDQGQNIIYVRKPVAPEDQLEKPVVRLIDPAGLRQLEDGSLAIGTQMTAYYDTPVTPANNNVYTGIEATRKLMAINPNTGKPHILFDQSLINFFSERRKYRLKQDTSGRNAHATKAEPIRKNNHLMDVLRYMCTYATFMFGGEIDEHRRRGAMNHAIQPGAATKMADRMEQHARDLREIRKRQYAGNNFVGSEW